MKHESNYKRMRFKIELEESYFYVYDLINEVRVRHSSLVDACSFIGRFKVPKFYLYLVKE